MKKIISAIIFSAAILLMCMLCVNAQEIGSVVNETVYTDIIASINDYNIASFNIDGYTTVVAEDLRNYGFDVQWIPDQRALYIKRAHTSTVLSTYVAPEIPAWQVGQKAFDVLATDIKTYINGNLVTSYNIGGLTTINFNDLAVFGTVNYDNSIRRLDLDIGDGLNYKIELSTGNNIFADSFLYFEVNSADGIQVRWQAQNNSNKTIKYYTTTYYMFNAVGDFAYDLFGKNYFTCKTIGPVEHGDQLIDFTAEYKAEVYDAPARYLLLDTIELIYMDGTTETIYYDQIAHRR